MSNLITAYCGERQSDGKRHGEIWRWLGSGPQAKHEVIWCCPHDHEQAMDAVRCAEAELASRHT